MASVKISELPTIDTPTSADVLIVNDVDSGITSKMPISKLMFTLPNISVSGYGNITLSGSPSIFVTKTLPSLGFLFINFAGNVATNNGTAPSQFILTLNNGENFYAYGECLLPTLSYNKNALITSVNAKSLGANIASSKLQFTQRIVTETETTTTPLNIAAGESVTISGLFYAPIVLY